MTQAKRNDLRIRRDLIRGQGRRVRPFHGTTAVGRILPFRYSGWRRNVDLIASRDKQSARPLLRITIPIVQNLCRERQS